MPWHTPRTWASTVVTAPQLNEDIRDNENVLKTSIDDNGHLYYPVIQNKTADYTIVATDDIVICTANSFTVTLLTAVGRSGKPFIVKNTGTGTITMASTSSQTIDGASAGSVTLSQGDAITFISDGANWITPAQPVFARRYNGTTASVSNTAVETAFATFSIPDQIKDGDVIELVLAFTAKNNSTASRTPTTKLYFSNASGLDISQSSAWSDNANTFHWIIAVRLIRVGADVWVVAGGSSTALQGHTGWIAFRQDLTTTSNGEGTTVISAPSFTSPVSIILKQTFPVANGNLFLTCSQAKATKIGS